jgi:hypothetical protein
MPKAERGTREVFGAVFQIFVSLFPCFPVCFPVSLFPGKQGNRETAFLILQGKQGNNSCWTLTRLRQNIRSECKKIKKIKYYLRKKWRETRRETGKLFPWETGKQGNSSFEN